MTTRTLLVATLVLALSGALAWAAEPPAKPVPPPVPLVEPVPPPPPPPVKDPLEKDIEISGVKIAGAIEGENITFVLDLTAKLRKPKLTLDLVTGDVALESVDGLPPGSRITYANRTYSVFVEKAGEYKVKTTFACRPVKIEAGVWRECSFTVPLSTLRELEVTSDRPDLDIVFPNAMRVQRQVQEKQPLLKTTAILGVGSAFSVRWKPQVEKLPGKLVAAAEVNTIASVTAGALRLDAVVEYAISQGETKEFKVTLPAKLNVTQVRGAAIQDWSIALAGDTQTLTISLTQPQKQSYMLQIQGEAALPEFPADFDLPLIEAVGVIRSSGYATVGTDSAIQLKLKQAVGLTQIDASAFRLVSDPRSPRTLPTRSRYSYRYAATPYQLTMTASDIKPSLDASQQVVVDVRDDDLIVLAAIELIVRDAPIREVLLRLPKGFSVADVTGNDIVPNGQEIVTAPDGSSRIRVPFKEPVMGHRVLNVRLEIGASPLGATRAVSGLDVVDAKNERGYIVLAADQGIVLDVKKPAGDSLRDVHTGSVPMRVARAQMAYRFTQPGWSFELTAKQSPPSIRCEVFQLASIGEDVVYDSYTLTFSITGAPVDKLRFRVPKALGAVQFVGRDVQNQKLDKDEWTVSLRRRVLGDYTLLITANQHYKPAGDTITIGGVGCPDAGIQVGYIAVVSPLNLTLEGGDTVGTNLLRIEPEELPGLYRNIPNAPILRTFKYVKVPSVAELAVTPYKSGKLLSMISDMMEIQTIISEEGEAVTSASYHIKNASEQSVRIRMPRDARIWSADIVQRGADGRESRERLMTSEEKVGDEKILIVPLERYRDPNQPAQIVVKYAQPGRTTLGLRYDYALTAPQAQVQSTFARWTMTLPKKFAFDDVQSRMASETPPAREPGLGAVGLDLARRYGRVLGNIVRSFEGRGPAGPAFLAGILVFLGLAFVAAAAALKRRWLGGTVALVLALLWLCLGLGAVSAPVETAVAEQTYEAQAAQISFTQTLNVSREALQVEATIVPAWAAGLFTTRTIAIAVVSLLLIALGIVQRGARRLGFALGIAGLVCAAAMVPVARIAVAGILLWALPFLPLLMVFVRLALPIRRLAPAAAMLLIAAVLPLGCAQRGEILPPETGVVIDRTDVLLNAEKDSMEVAEHLIFRTNRHADIPVLWGPAALMEAPADTKDVQVEMTTIGCTLHVKQKGEHDVTVKFLLPLDKANPDGLRRFSMALPQSIMAFAHLAVPEVNLEVASPDAAKLTRVDEAKQTTADAVLGPVNKVTFEWKPRSRETKREQTSFFVDTLTSLAFRAGVVESVHAFRLQIAQGELKDMQIRIPEGMAVTSIDGRNLGAWMYDPAKRVADVRLTEPATGEYLLVLVTQVTQQKLPYDVTLGLPDLVGATRQRGAVGIYPASDVYVEVKQHPAVMNPEDFAGAIAAAVDKRSSAALAPRYAYRYEVDPTKPAPSLTANVRRVEPEIRSEENAAFSVADDRLVYNTELAVTLTKAGIFSFDLRLPAGYDIDNLTSPEVSHWDEEKQAGGSVVTVHLRNQLPAAGQTLACVQLSLTLSRTTSELRPDVPITVPRITVVGTLKHTGKLVVSSDPGIRVSLKDRTGISPIRTDLDAAKDALIFKLLQQDWQIVLTAEKIEPRLEVEFLHVAQVSEGLVRSVTHMRYTVHNAGVKFFQIQLPADLTGVDIEGKNIAKSREVREGSGLWEIELASKVQRYLLHVRYEERFDLERDEVRIAPAQAVGADLQRGHIVVRASQKVELSEKDAQLPLKRSDPRAIQTDLGERDLFDAALCYQTASAEAKLLLKARRHAAADILSATVSSVEISTVVTEEGNQVSSVHLVINVGTKRNLEVTLPAKSQLWSLLVNGASTVPSLANTWTEDKPVYLIPLASAGSPNATAELDFIYVTPRQPGWSDSTQAYEGPRFDLPLQNIRWMFFVPETFKYRRFRGTLRPDDEVIDKHFVQSYDTATYITNTRQTVERNLRMANDWLNRGQEFERQGYQQEAKQAYGNAYNGSFGDQNLNEDARVRVLKLQKQQTIVALVNRRDNVRPRAGQGLLQPQVSEVGPNFTEADAKRVEQSLSQEESEALDQIADRVRGQQDAAVRVVQPLNIQIAQRGRVLAFERDLQVNKDVEMSVSFAASAPGLRRNSVDYLWGVGLAAVLFGLLLITRRRAQPEEPEPPPYPSAPSSTTPPATTPPPSEPAPSEPSAPAEPPPAEQPPAEPPPAEPPTLA